MSVPRNYWQSSIFRQIVGSRSKEQQIERAT